MTPYLLLICLWWQTEHTVAFWAPSTSASRSLVLGTKLRAAEKADAWADGTNAAPAIMCEVDNIPLLDPVPDGFKRLFLVRHGEVINPGGDRPVYYGAMDVSLSPLGELEAIEAGSYLSRYHLQHVASSPLSRAKFGARQVLARQQPTLAESSNTDSNDIVIFGGFKELDRGAWCGLTKDEIGVDMLARFDACDESVTPGDGGESYPALKSRVLEARDELLEMTEVGKSSAIISHLQVTRAILHESLGMDVTELAGLKISTASITCVDYCANGTGKQVVRFQSFKPECGLEESKDGAN